MTETGNLSFEDWEARQLQDPEFQVECIKAVLEMLMESIRFLGQARAASDAMACDLEFDEESDEWRDHLEPLLMDAYGKASEVLAKYVEWKYKNDVQV